MKARVISNNNKVLERFRAFYVDKVKGNNRSK